MPTVQEAKQQVLVRRVLFGLVALVLIISLYEAVRVFLLAHNLRSNAKVLEAGLEAGLADLELQQTVDLLHETRENAEALQARLRWIMPLTNSAGWVPWVGPKIAAVGPLVDYAAGLAIAADEVVTAIEPLLLDLEGQDSSGGLSSRLLSALRQASVHIETSQRAVDQAAAARQRFAVGDLPPSIQRYILRIDPYQPLLQRGVRLFGMLPQFLGLNHPAQYLLLAQNQDELRATGGFISGVGSVLINDGQVASLTMGDSYAVDDFSLVYPIPPAPLFKYMLAEQWLVRDANWSPDFPNAAQTIGQLYEYSTGEQIDGVIAFDQQTLVRLLQVTGPLSVPGADEPITAGNVASYMHQSWEPEPGEGLTEEWWLERKSFMGDLGRTLFARLQSAADRQEMITLARAVFELLEEKHLLIYLKEEAVRQALAGLGIDGAVLNAGGDQWMVVDSNVGFNKVDVNIDRSIDYVVDLRQPAAPLGALTIHYQNTVSLEIPCVHQPTYGQGTYEDMQQRCYWNYLRVYAPPGARLVDGQLPPVPASFLMNGIGENGEWTVEEGEHAAIVFGGIFVLPTAQRAAISLSYSLPAAILEEAVPGQLVYRLTVYKQPGTSATPLRLTVLPPEGYSVAEMEGWEVMEGGGLSWSGNLQKNRSFEVVFAEPALR